MKPIDDVAFWREKCGEYQDLYRKTQENADQALEMVKEYQEKFIYATQLAETYKRALDDIMAHDEEKVSRQKNIELGLK